MNRLGFAPFDSVFQASLNARNAMQDLHVAIHYAGVSTASRPRQPGQARRLRRTFSSDMSVAEADSVGSGTTATHASV